MVLRLAQVWVSATLRLWFRVRTVLELDYLAGSLADDDPVPTDAEPFIPVISI